VKTEADGRAAARRRPTSEETFAAAIDLVTRGSSGFKRFAQRYSLCAADAEDAYQRSLEILLRKAPTADRRELRAWLHTVIKHEALAVRRQRERTVAGAGEEPEPPAETTPALDEQASGRERVRRTAEALAQLKQSELQCLLLKALGYSYDEIAERTGYSWTKVNRSLTEGRRRFLVRFGELSSGRGCRDFEALLSIACDGEASREQERSLRTHLDGCGSCRAALRTYRDAPGRLAELFPPGVAIGFTQQQGWLSRFGDWLAVNTGDRAGALAWKAQQSAEAVSAQKAAAVLASTAAIAGGTAVQEHRGDRGRPDRPATAKREAKARTAQTVPVPAAPPVAAPAPAPPSPPTRDGAAGDQRSDRDAAPAEEFAPAPAAAGAPAAASAAQPAASTEPEFGGPGGGAGGGGGEFGP
jgi:RNA polymerase sigma factor (sigma-70 family)